MLSPSETTNLACHAASAPIRAGRLSQGRTLRPAAAITAAAFGMAVFASPLNEARADNVSPNGKGIAGGGLMGAEVVTMVEALFGVRAGWAYVLGGLVGAGGGAAGGYAIERSSTDGKVPTYMLAGGLALVIPAIVLTLNATRYLPEEGATEDRAPTGPAAEPGVVVGTPPGGGAAGTPGTPVQGGAAPSPAPTPPQPPQPGAPTPPPQSLLDVTPGAQGSRLRIGVPVPNIVPVFTVGELRQYGMKNDTELRMPVLHVTF